MAISTPPVLEASGGASAASVVLASFTPPANALLIAFCSGRGASAGIPTISDDLGGTWTAVAAGQDTGVITGRLFTQVIGASPAAMVVTIASASATQTSGTVTSLTGAGTDFSNYQFDITSVTGDPSLTMGTFAANSTCLGWTAVTAGGAITSPTGYTELLDATLATNHRITHCYDSASPGTAMSWTGGGTQSLGIGLEIKETLDAVFAGTAPVTFAQTGALAAETSFAGTTPVVFSQTGNFVAGTADAVFTGTIAVTFSQTGSLLSDAALAATTTVTFGQTGGLVAGAGTQTSATSAGTYNMYRPADWDEDKPRLRKIKYLGPAEERLTFHVEATKANKWIPSTIRAPSVLDKIESSGLMVRRISGAKLRRMTIADDEWLMLN